MLMKVEWGEVAQWSKFWMSSDSGISRSICPIIGGPEHRSILPLDRNQLTVERSGCSYYLQEINVDGEIFTAYRCDGLSDSEYRTMLRSWLVGYYEEKINELSENKLEIA